MGKKMRWSDKNARPSPCLVLALAYVGSIAAVAYATWNVIV
jgi:hypothetical protein